MRRDRPVACLKIIASLMPKDLSIKVDPYAHMSDEELMAHLQHLEGQDGTAPGSESRGYGKRCRDKRGAAEQCGTPVAAAGKCMVGNGLK